MQQFYPQKQQLHQFAIRNNVRIVRSCSQPLPILHRTLDDQLSKRHIQLDPEGYFIIKPDFKDKLIIAELYSNNINDRGLACDPATGEVIGCREKNVRRPKIVFKGRSAKELCVEVIEKSGISFMLDHAAYLGREFQKAEFALVGQNEYIQD
eukprot:TRINITY_DN1930_c0_g1_i1.p1 TRINITY_DN1930_c0_g1~~TRINITY_DN1930_c0_g1_i1.p1  ORF type:complete len:152 (-),score=7.84 TRINITY_DN1930_c0_g1_i1:67-522(-)